MQGTDLNAVVTMRVRTELRLQGVTQHELARRIGMSRMAVSRRLNEEVAFNLHDVDGIARALDVPAERLLSAAS
jgi:transcriptional regulator with XRE-family HTH domain